MHATNHTRCAQYNMSSGTSQNRIQVQHHLYRINEACSKEDLELLKLALVCLRVTIRPVERIKSVCDACRELNNHRPTADQSLTLLYAILREMPISQNEVEELKKHIPDVDGSLKKCESQKEFRFARMIIKLCNDFTDDDFKSFREFCMPHLLPSINPNNFSKIEKLFLKLIQANKVVWPEDVSVLQSILSLMNKERSLKFIDDYKRTDCISQSSDQAGSLGSLVSAGSPGSLVTPPSEHGVNSIEWDGAGGLNTCEQGSSHKGLPPEVSQLFSETEILFCRPPQENKDVPKGSEAGAIDPNKGIWDSSKKELKVFFINPEFLQKKLWKCGKEPLTTEVVLAWATRGWNNPLYPDYPRISHYAAESADDADIKVKFGSQYCRCFYDVNQRYMFLYLDNNKKKEQESLVLHEFGHALGLQHEHQRTDLWDVLDKFLDSTSFPASQYERFPFENKNKSLKTPYDPDSIMHYWFKINWLKKDYRDLNSKSVRDLPEDQKRVVEGVHKRDPDNGGLLAEKPSQLDYEALNNFYKLKKSQEN